MNPNDVTSPSPAATSNGRSNGRPTVSTVRVPAHVVHRAFVDETVVLNLETGKYHGLNPTAGRMLATLERTGELALAAAALAEEFDKPQAEIEADLGIFCKALIDRGLLEAE
jgi:hypothetical protein